MKTNTRESTANLFSLKVLDNAIRNHKPRKDLVGENNPQFRHGNGEKYRRIRINGIKVKMSHIVFRLNTRKKIRVGYNIHHKDENKRNDNFYNLEEQRAVQHGKMNLRKGNK